MPSSRRTTAAAPVLAACVVLLFAAAAARATIFVPMSIEDLTRSSLASVIGTVQEVRGVEARDGQLYTLVTIAVEQVLHGELREPVIVLKENGGRVGSRQEVEFGTPSFAPGRHVLLFLTAWPDGSLRTNHLALGKFDLTVDRTGMPRAHQRFGAGATVLPLPGGIAAPPPTSLGTILHDIAAAGHDFPAPAAVLAVPPEGSDTSLRTEITEPLEFLGGRFFEPDEGTPLSFVIDQRGDALLGLTDSRQAVDAAFAVWSSIPSANVHLQDGGLTSDVSTPCPGPHVIIFNDPMGAIPPPQSCTGTLAVGGYCQTTFESKHFGGRGFDRALRARVTFADGWDGCGLWTACNLAEIATHELGHAIGLAHSSENFSDPDEVLRDATMYYRAHFDGRCAATRTYDQAAVSALYPTAMPPTIETGDPLPPAQAGMPYNQMLTATGGAGGFTWSLGRGGFPGLTLDANGDLSGVPAYGGSSFFQVIATDTNGDSHTKILNIAVAGPTATPTRTPTRTATPTVTGTATPSPTVTDTETPSPTETPSATPSSTGLPTATATDTPTDAPTATPTSTPTDTPTDIPTQTPPPTPTATAIPPCIGDCDGSGTVTINELLTMVNIALDNAETTACLAGDRNHDGIVTIDELLAAVRVALTGCP